MNDSCEQIEIDALTQIYREKENALMSVLVSGVPWNEVKKDRDELTDLAAAILNRHFPGHRFLRQTFKYQIEEKTTLQVGATRSSWNLRKLVLKWAYLFMAFPLALLLFISLRFVFYMSRLIKLMKRFARYNSRRIEVSKD